VKPGPERFLNPEVAGLLDQDEKGCLERVLRLMGVVKLGAAHAQDHGPVPLDESGERQLGGLGACGRESLEQLAVGQVSNRAVLEKRHKLALKDAATPGRHGSAPSARRFNSSPQRQ
jgi:hypothetical protein